MRRKVRMKESFSNFGRQERHPQNREKKGARVFVDEASERLRAREGCEATSSNSTSY